MRVANKMIYDSITYYLSGVTEDMNKANEVVASGKRITNLSDDPVGLIQSLKIKSDIQGIDQLGRNITLGKSWLNASESALSQVGDIISEVKALCVWMANTTVGGAERASGAETVQNMKEEIASLGNTEVNGRFIFAGSKTDTAPFSEDGTYNGNNNPFSIKIGVNTTMEVGQDGDDVFGTIFTSLSNLKTALENDDVSGIRTAMSDMDDQFQHISSKISHVGSEMIRMEIKEAIYQDLKISNSDRLSKIEDADITEAIVDLKSKELQYQAALSSSAKVMELSLMNYL